MTAWNHFSDNYKWSEVYFIEEKEKKKKDKYFT